MSFLFLHHPALRTVVSTDLAKIYPDLAEHLLNIHKNIYDLLAPFRAGYYYLPDMGGSFSIKSVLPALCPAEPSLNYHNLDERCQNGGDAMTIYLPAHPAYGAC